MFITLRRTMPALAATGIAIALMSAPAAAAQIDPCDNAVSTSRCLGPQGIAGFEVPNAGGGGQNGPYGPWGRIPPLG